jgi:(p)ppGpp synthase/HD superfamily hydrolase
MHFSQQPDAVEIFGFVCDIHRDQRHSGEPYSHHLLGVWNIYRLAGLDERDDYLIALTHDAVDDAGDRKAEVEAFFAPRLSAFVLRVIHAMSAVGHNRKARNEDWMSRIEAFPEAANYKVGDRIFNMEAAGKRDMYLKEDEEFTRRIVSLATNQYLIDRYHKAAGR